MPEYRITIEVDTDCITEHLSDLLIDRLIEEYTADELKTGLDSRDARNELLTFHGVYPAKINCWYDWICDGYGVTDYTELEYNLGLDGVVWTNIDDLIYIEADCLACFADELRYSAEKWQECVLDTVEGRRL